MMTKEKNSAVETKGFLVRNHKTIYFTVIGIMCLLIALCIKLSIDNNVLRDIFSTANTYMDIVLMAFLTMLFGFSASDKYAVGKQNAVFSLLIVVDFMMLFCSTLAYMVYGIAEKAGFIRVAGSIGYLFCCVSFTVLWKYQTIFYKNTPAVRVSTQFFS